MTKKSNVPDTDTLMRVDGTTTEAHPKNGKSYELQELYMMLGCDMVQVVPSMMARNTIIICDEEGLLKANPVVNPQASNAAGIPIVGNALVCHTKRFK